MAEKGIRNEASSSNSGGNLRGESIVVDVGRRRSSCGYCKSGAHSSISHGVWAHSLTVDDYQALLDRGWRRSGCFLYKPEMERTCCPSYTIRLRASDFVQSKEQLRVLKRMQRLLNGTLNAKKLDEYTEPSTSSEVHRFTQKDTQNQTPVDFLVNNGDKESALEQLLQCLSDQIDAVLRTCIDQGEFPCDIQLPKVSVKTVPPAKRKLFAEGSQNLLCSSNVAFQIAAALRRASMNIHQSMEEAKQCAEISPSMIAEKLSNNLGLFAVALNLSVKACNGHVNFYYSTNQSYSDLFEKIDSHKDSSLGSQTKRDSLKKGSRSLPLKELSLEIHLKRSSFDPEEYALYRRYQIKVHNDSPDRVSESSYRRFLVDSPLVYVPSTGDSAAPPCGFGSFHQQYLIDGRLVAVGVIDILPNCLSSKYLFWDPDFAFLSLGKYSALQEIDWVRENQVHCPSLQFYYLGYYIHSCSKMRYKAAYRPTELLCPLRYQWVPFDNAKPLLDRQPYVVLSDFATLQSESSWVQNSLGNHIEQQDDPDQGEVNDVPIDEDEEMSELDSEDSDAESGPEATGHAPVLMENSVSNILISLKGKRFRYKDLRQAFGPEERYYLETQLQRYTTAVGVDLSERMVYSLG